LDWQYLKTFGPTALRLTVVHGAPAAVGVFGLASAAFAEWRRQRSEARAEAAESAAAQVDLLRAEFEARTARAEAAQALIERNWRSGTPPGLESLTREQVAQARLGFLFGKTHIAIVGHSGAGKSTLTNRLRGLSSDKGPDAAFVSENEATRVTSRYEDAIHPQHVWYDVPGAGTPSSPDWQYFMDHKLYAYDALIVAFADRITATDLTILKNAKECGIPTFFVRTKSDQIMRNMAMAEVGEGEEDEDEWASPWQDARMMQERYIESSREYARTMLAEAGLDDTQPVYLVSGKGVYLTVKGNRPPNTPLDEVQLIHDLLQVNVN
jgi:GTP-binding protein EngB required for normal cell division